MTNIIRMPRARPMDTVNRPPKKTERDPDRLHEEIKRLIRIAGMRTIKRREAEARFKAAKADKQRLAQHIDQLRSEIATLKWHLEQERRKHAPVDGSPFFAGQVNRLVDAWEAAEPDARREFQRRVGTVISLGG